MKIRIYQLLVLFLTCTLLGGCGSRAREAVNVETSLNSQPAVSEEKLVETMEVSPKPLAYTLSAVGSLKSPENVTLSPKRSGIIKKILVKEGDRIKKGQVLVQLDDVDAILLVESAEARVQEAETSLETSRNTLVRYEKLLESKVIPQQTYDNISLKAKLGEAELTLAKSALNQAKQNLIDQKIMSPIEGMVCVKIASVGEHVNVAPKDPILTIIQMDPLDLEFNVPEIWVGKIRPGSKIDFTVKAFSEEKFNATLQFISPSADPSTRNVRMVGKVQNPNYRLKPGYFAEVTLQTGVNPDALVIPESALFSQGGRFYTYTVEDGIAKRKEVETGVRFEGKVEILKGIQTGDRVVTAGHEQLSDGTKVRTNIRS
jgi:membrane fusion protein (multidrug efflux system)